MLFFVLLFVLQAALELQADMGEMFKRFPKGKISQVEVGLLGGKLGLMYGKLVQLYWLFTVLS